MALEITDWTLPSNKRVVEVSFSDNERDDPPSLQFWVTLYISEQGRGGEHDRQSGIDGKRYVWSDADDEAQQKAETCLPLLASTTQPRELPSDPRRVVTVRWFDGWIERKFPIEEVPAQIRELLLTMGFRNEDFRRLTFIP